MSDTSTHKSRKHGYMQINRSTWRFWFDQNNSGNSGNHWPLNNKTIGYWLGPKSPLTKADKEWFNKAIFE